MNEVWVVWASCDDMPETKLAGIASKEEKANEMVKKLHEVFEDAFEYEVEKCSVDSFILNDVEVFF